MEATADDKKSTCPLCDATSSHCGQHPDFQSAQLYHCVNCQYWYTTPEPSTEELLLHYKNVYNPARKSHSGPAYFQVMRRRAKAQLEFLLSEISLDCPGFELTSATILDLGCGLGSLVAEINDVGGNAVGYDQDEYMIKLGQEQGHTSIHFGDVDPDERKGQFDLLCLSHVVEHLRDIQNISNQIYQFVRSKGYIFIEVPNCFEEMFKHGIDCESHLRFFTAHSLRKMLETAGLEVLTSVCCGPPKFKAYGIPTDDESKLITIFRSYWNGASSFSQRLLQPFLPVKTIYDGYYDHYYPPGDASGMWLRVLAKNP